MQAEDQFNASRINAKTNKYLLAVASIPPATESGVRDTLLATTPKDAYRLLKEALTRPPNPSKPQRLQQLQREAELGNCRTSQLLRQIQQLASCTEKLRQSLGARALPSKIGRNQADRRECFVRNGCPQDRETSCLTHCGHPASNCHITLAEASSVPNLLDIRTDISHLASTVTALQSSGS
ncbi:hypothetical protein MRX96_048504 [Rhipicephalus microplus]